MSANLLFLKSADWTTGCYSLYYSYNVCIRQEAGMSCITYQQCDDTSSWTLDLQAMPVSTAAATGTVHRMTKMFQKRQKIRFSDFQMQNNPIMTLLCPY